MGDTTERRRIEQNTQSTSHKAFLLFNPLIVGYDQGASECKDIQGCMCVVVSHYGRNEEGCGEENVTAEILTLKGSSNAQLKQARIVPLNENKNDV